MLLTIQRGNRRETVELERPMLLSQALAGRGLPLAMPCGGRRQCRKCRVVARGALSPLCEQERALLTPAEIAAGVRFACMTTVEGDAAVCFEADEGADHILSRGALPAFALQPWAAGMGAAVDIGTTTLAAYLYRLTDGHLLGTGTAANPQASFGADVITRLDKALHGQGRALAEAVRAGLRDLLGDLCAGAGEEPAALDCLVLTGNTAMLYLLCQRDPSSIAAAPFVQDDDFGRTVPAGQLDLPLRPDVPVYLTRVMSAYVGGDLTSAALAAGFAERRDGVDLLCDIGTNGEMLLRCGDIIYGCSTAAGPAFEGAGLHHGMTARGGAVHRVSRQGNSLSVEVLGGGEAVGICGSGVVDALAVLLDLGLVDETGLFCEDAPGWSDCFTEVDGAPAFRLPGTAVVVTQADVRAIQLAKSAICAGMTALLAKAGITAEQVDRFLIAGGFGSCIDVGSATRIGMFLPGLASKAAVLGNAAGMGACMALLSQTERDKGEALATGCETVELSTDPVFMEAYVAGMLFPEAE